MPSRNDDNNMKNEGAVSSLSPSMEMNKFTLGFKSEVESDFKVWYFNRSLSLIRWTFFFAVIVFGAFGIIDALLYPDVKNTLWLYRYAVLVPLFLLGVILTFNRFFAKIHQYLLTIIIVLVSGAIAAKLAAASLIDTHMLYSEIILVIICISFFLRIRFIFALIGSTLSVAVFLAILAGFSEIPGETLVKSIFILLGFNFLGIIAAYLIEYFQRREFYLLYLLKSETDKVIYSKKELEKRVDVRTEELTREIEERKKIEQDLLSAKRKAEENSKLKSSLMANMNHEFRTPLNGILGFATLLSEELQLEEESDLDVEEIKEMVERIKGSGTRLMNTLNAVLELSRLESINEDLKYIEVDLAYNIVALKMRYEKVAKEKGLQLNIILKEKTLYVVAVEQMLNQAVNSILDNAIKYTNEGEVRVILERIKEDDQEWGLIKVVDTGIGVEKENQPVIFEAFRQVSEGFGRAYEGAGLGLTIAKRIIKLMKGEITLESEPGKGSTFTIKLPAVADRERPRNEYQIEIAQGENKPARKKAESDEELPKVLLVEDNETNRYMTMKFLDGYCDLEIAADGDTAVDMASNTQFSAILMDINLGVGISGVEATRKIRELPGYKDIPVVAVTGYAALEDKEKFLSEGLTHFLAKPFEKDEIIELIQDLFDENNR